MSYNDNNDNDDDDDNDNDDSNYICYFTTHVSCKGCAMQ